MELKVETKFMELNDAMREYHEVFGHELKPLPLRLVLSDLYTSNEEHHDKQLAFIAWSMTETGGVMWWLEKS